MLRAMTGRCPLPHGCPYDFVLPGLTSLKNPAVGQNFIAESLLIPIPERTEVQSVANEVLALLHPSAFWFVWVH